MKAKVCGIYKITSPSNRIYIGQSIDCVERKRRYKTSCSKGQTFLFRSIKKHGFEKHKFEIIHQCLPEQLNELEKYYVDLFQTFNSKMGLNLRDGGGSNGKLSNETKIKMSIASKGKPKSELHKNKLREANLGKKASNEAKNKMSLSRIGNTHAKGKKHSEEAKLRMSKSAAKTHWWHNTPMKNKKHSEETKQKIREKAIKRFTF